MTAVTSSREKHLARRVIGSQYALRYLIHSAFIGLFVGPGTGAMSLLISLILLLLLFLLVRRCSKKPKPPSFQLGSR